jgi:acyl-CoA synthetase (NDP forming)
MGFDGAVWPVHPERREIEGLPAFPSLDALPAAPDAAFIGVNRRETIRVARALREQGAGGAVGFASGFAETGPEGAALQAELVEAAEAMPLLGPNCYGFINALDGALLWPDLHGCARVESGVGIITQSSNIAINLTMARRALPIGYVVCLGNQAVIGLPDAIEGLAADPRVTVIALHIEAIADPRGFARAAAFARAEGKSLVALRAGRSEGARDLVLSHTASLAGAAGVGEAFLRRVGVAEVDSIPELLETAKILHFLGPIGDGGLVTMSCSGGEASLIADAAERARVRLPEFSPARRAAIHATVNPLVTVSNPFDYHTFDWGHGDRLRETFGQVMRSGQAATALVLDFPKRELGPAEGWDIAVESFTRAARETGAKSLVIATVPECLPEDRAARLTAERVAPMQGLAETMTAVRAAAELGEWLTLPAFDPLPPRVGSGPPPRALDEAEGKARMAAFGLAVPEGQVCRAREEALAAAARLAPVAMKAVGANLAHKSEIGAVRLNVKTRAEAADAWTDLRLISDRVLVERMVPSPVAELIVGTARDPALGLYMIIGAGGVLAELISDRRIVIPPAGESDILVALDGLKADRLLRGWRGGAAANREAVVAAIKAIAAFVVANASDLEELDVNPLIATADGAIAADVFLRLRGA